MTGLKHVSKNLNNLLIFIGIFVLSISSFAMNGRTTYQAKIIKPDGQPLEATSVNFRFSVLDTSGSCALYVEDYAAVNMSGSGGLISFALGGGTRSFPTSGTSLTFRNIFENVGPYPCRASNLTVGSYSPGVDDARKVVMQFQDTSGWQTLPAMAINAVPYAMYAHKANSSLNSQQLNGKTDASFVEYSTLAGLSCAADQAIKFNGVSFSCITVTGGGGSGISSVSTSGTVLNTGGTASAPVISITAATMSTDGYLTSLDYAEFKAKLSASSTQITNALGFSPVSSTAVAAQISTALGGVTSSQVLTSINDTAAASSSNTANTIVKRDSSGNSSFSGLSALTASLNYVDIYRPSTSFNIRLQAPTSLAANYTLILPNTSGTTGQVLATDASGNLSWVNPSNGSVTSVSATTPLSSTGGVTPTISISQATSSTNGYLSSSDFNTFNNKQNATSSAIIATLGYTPADNSASGTYVIKSSNLSDLTNIITARSNLGLGTFATASTVDLGSASATGIIADARLADQSNISSGTQYTKVTVDGKGRVVSGAQMSSSDVTTALGYTPATSTTLAASFVQKAGDTMTGLLNLAQGTSFIAPLKFTSGTLLSSAQSGTIEYDGAQLYFTDGLSVRRALATNSGAGSFDNTSLISNTSGNITLAPNNITGSVIVNSNQASISSGTGALVVNGGVGIAGSINAAGNLNLVGSATISQSLLLSSLTNGSLLFAGSSGLVSEDNSRLFWDSVNKRLGLGTNSPSQTLSVSGASYFSGNVGIGTISPEVSALVDISSTTKGFLPPRMTTLERTAIASAVAGLVVFNTTANVLEVFNGSNWIPSGQSIPNGAIMPFNTATCPAGWTPYVAAQDRVILGSGNTYALGATGGSNTATTSNNGSHAHTGNTNSTVLTLAQIPSHNHTGTTDSAGAHSHSWSASRQLQGVDDSNYSTEISKGDAGAPDTLTKATDTQGTHTHNFTTGNTGGGAGHDHAIASDGDHGHVVDVRQPYVALLYCQYAGGTPGIAPPAIAGLTGVNITGPSNGQALIYNNVSGLWENQSISSVLGFTPVNKNGDTMTGALSLPLNGLTVGANQLVVSGGNVGIGTSSPAATLSVSGGVQVGGDSVCNASKAGTVRYNNSSLEFCNGTTWKTAGSPDTSETYSATGLTAGLNGTTGGAVGFTVKQNSNAAVFDNLGTTGIRILKAGKIHVSYTQDIKCPSVYSTMTIRLNASTIIARNLANPSADWVGLTAVGSYTVAANDVLDFTITCGGNITQIDSGDWSIMSIFWTGQP